MKMLIVTTKKDPSGDRIFQECEKQGLGVIKYLYEDISRRFSRSSFQGFDYCMLRDPYNSGEDFSLILDKILSLFSPNKILDYKVFIKHPKYEDKLFQHKLFQDHVRMARYNHFLSKGEINGLSYPIVVKKRISSRGRDIFVLNNKKETLEFFCKHSISDYIFEEHLDIKSDIRVMLIGHKIIGAVERRMRFKDNKGYKGIGVKVIGEYKLTDDLKRKSVLVSKIIKCNFCGLDFIIDKKNKYYLVECNISPQFNSFERELKVNVAGKLVGYINKIS